jgi:cysteine-rich repeat protein
MRTLQPLRGLLISAALLLPEVGCTIEIYDQDQERATCGNAVLDSGEQCDDGNNADGDGCSSACTLEHCGDRVVTGSSGEICDDGNNADGDGCSADCRSNETCGNATIDAARGEECDTGGASATCDPDCTLARCGDGVWNAPAGEECDTGGESATCDVDCTLALCGDGIRNPAAGEACDLGTQNSDTGACLASCQLARCGDGHTQTGVELCDDGNVINGDGCENDCTLTP